MNGENKTVKAIAFKEPSVIAGDGCFEKNISGLNLGISGISRNLISGFTVGLEEMSLCKSLPSARHLSSRAVSGKPALLRLVSTIVCIVLVPNQNWF